MKMVKKTGNRAITLQIQPYCENEARKWDLFAGSAVSMRLLGVKRDYSEKRCSGISVPVSSVYLPVMLTKHRR